MAKVEGVKGVVVDVVFLKMVSGFTIWDHGKGGMENVVVFDAFFRSFRFCRVIGNRSERSCS